LNQYKGEEQVAEMKESDAYKTLSELADWTASNWLLMSEHVSSSRAVFDLCKQKEGRSEGSGQRSSGNQLISLHSVIQQSKAGATSGDAVRE
jgi:hypothetical protein